MASAELSADTGKVKDPLMADDMTELSISTPHHRLKGYLATPQGAGPWPGVIVLHDIFGLTDVTRGHADWLAREGYLAVTPDLFSWGGRIRCIRALWWIWRRARERRS